jgi:alpha-L-fucosidase
MFVERIPPREYAKLANEFRPGRFNADDWVSLADNAGMKYLTFTARHHDGFCLYDSQVSDFTSVKTAAGRDFVADVVAACRKRGIKVGIYYSLLDWRFPGWFNRKEHSDSAQAMVDQAHAQVRELMTNYGPIDILCYDGGWLPGPNNTVAPEFWRAQALNNMVRKLQPHILINDRSGLKEDYDTPEQTVTASPAGRCWESCMTIGDFCTWGYVEHNPNLKPTTQLIQHLVTAASQAGNFILNIGPRADGTVQEEFVDGLGAIGVWMRVNGESIRGSERLPAGWGSFGQFWPAFGGMLGTCTAKGNRVYLHVFRWPGSAACITGIKSKVRSARLLATGQNVKVEQDGNGRLVLKNLPKLPPDPYDTVIALELEGRPESFSYEGTPLA